MSSRVSGECDVAVVGGGHNGLVAAARLARAGRRVVLLEARETLGGGAAEHEIAPGYRSPACAHLLAGLDARLVAELELARYGLDLSRVPLVTLGLAPETAPLELDAAGARRLTGSAPEPVDGAGLERLRTLLGDLAEPLAPWLDRAPPRLATRAPADLGALGRLGLALRGLGARRLRELLRVATMSVADLLEEHVEDGQLAGVLALEAVAGARLGPRSPGTVLTWLHRLALGARQGDAAAGRGPGRLAPIVPVGGFGRLVDALAGSARAAGAQLRVGTPVEGILLESDAVEGLALSGGEVLPARCVLSTLHPARTLLRLVGVEHLDVGLVRALRALRSRGAAAKLDLALDGPVEVPGLPASALAARLVISPGVDALEDAFNHVKYGEHSAEPALEVLVPSALDPELAPGAGQVLSALVLYAADRPRDDPGAARDALRDAAIARLESVLPGLAQRIVGAVLRTPAELEDQVGLGAGHWHHLEVGFDQLFWSRPLPELARGRTPIAGLYLGGAGSHPGGGVSGLPGANAARAVLAGSGP